jgi:hypothetical protein
MVICEVAQRKSLLGIIYYYFLGYLDPADDLLQGLEAVQLLWYLHHAGPHSSVQLRKQVLRQASLK